MRKVILSIISVFMVSMCVFAQTPAAITAWTRQTPIYPTGYAPEMGGAAIYGDYIYVLGGTNNTDGDTAKVFKIKVDQYTGAVESAVEITNFSTNANYSYISSACAAYNGYVYVGGGGYNSGLGAGPSRNDATFIKIVSNGDIDAAWSESTVFPSSYDPELCALVIVNGYLYIMGGDSESGILMDKCFYAKIKVDGTLDTWQTGTTLPSACNFSSACAVGNDIIMTQGLTTYFVNTSAVNTLYVCQTNPTTGAMGSWTLQASTFPSTIYGTRLVAVGDTIFTIGGRTSGGTGVNNVWRATYNTSTHTVGAWASTDTQLPDSVKYHDIVYSDSSKSLYIVHTRSGSTATIYDEVWISSPLFARPIPTPTPTPIPVLDAKNWEMYN